MADKNLVTMNYIPDYPNRIMQYSVVPVAKLFSGLSVNSEAIIQFQCLDGFSAPINTERLLNENPSGSIGYIAIEDPKHKWPPLKADSNLSAGPFHLVWGNPKASNIRNEEYPYQLVKFEVKSSLHQTYPDIFPDPKLDVNDAIHQGFKLFQQTCFACHTMNKNGSAQVGPDLNVPYNPTEYLNRKFLRILVRDPQAFHHWPQGRMLGFPENALTNDELEHIIDYLEHMSKRKIKN